MAKGVDPVRLARVVAGLASAGRDPEGTWCSVAARLVGVTGASVTLVSAGRPLGSVCVSDPMAAALEEIEYTLGESPCLEAAATSTRVLAPDLAEPDGRWPAFCDGALAVGVRAVFGVPLLVGSACIGALNLYEVQPGDLSTDQWADAEAVAQVTGRTVLGWQEVAGPGSLAWQLEQVPTHRAVVHQATGMVSVQAAASIDDALALLRAHAFAAGRPISEIAAEVVAGALRLE